MGFISTPALPQPVMGLGKVWVFEGAAVLPMSGFSTVSSWTFDQALICFLLTGLQFWGCWEGPC